MKTERRWLKSVIAAAADPMPAMPWERVARLQSGLREPKALPKLAQPQIARARPSAAMAAR